MYGKEEQTILWFFNSQRLYSAEQRKADIGLKLPCVTYNQTMAVDHDTPCQPHLRFRDLLRGVKGTQGSHDITRESQLIMAFSRRSKDRPNAALNVDSLVSAERGADFLHNVFVRNKQSKKDYITQSFSLKEVLLNNFIWFSILTKNSK